MFRTWFQFDDYLQDLKKYRFLYWFGFPAVSNISVYNVGCKSFKEEFEDLEMTEQTFCNSQSVLNDGYFVYETLGASNKGAGIKSLSQTATTNLENIYFGFVDPSSIEQHPGWNLRNYIAYIVLRWYNSNKLLEILVNIATCHHLMGRLKLIFLYFRNIKCGSILKILSYRPRKSSLTERSCIFQVKVEVSFVCCKCFTFDCKKYLMLLLLFSVNFMCSLNLNSWLVQNLWDGKKTML